MMKKIGCILAAAGLFFTGCGPQAAETPPEAPDRVQIVATIFPLYDFARQVAGDAADVTMLLPPGTESHSYDPSPQDILKVQNCDLFLYIGGESDAWLGEVLEAMDKPEHGVLRLMDTVDTLEEEVVEGMEAAAAEKDHAHTDPARGEGTADGAAETAPEYDEHIWTSPKNALEMVGAIRDDLCALDEANAETYRANAAAYGETLEELDAAFEAVVEAGKRREVLFGDRFPFRYFAEAYGLTYWAAFPGCSAETEPSAATVAYLIDKIKTDGLPVVFYLEFSNRKVADILAESTGAKPLLFHSCHTVTKEAFDNGVTYTDLMEQNLKNLEEALN